MPRVIERYALHVSGDGVEYRYDQIPELVRGWTGAFVWQDKRALPVHHVHVLELEDGRIVEEIRVRCIKVDRGSAFLCPKPHGQGWTVYDAISEDKFTTFRRSPPKRKALPNEQG